MQVAGVSHLDVLPVPGVAAWVAGTDPSHGAVLVHLSASAAPGDVAALRHHADRLRDWDHFALPTWLREGWLEDGRFYMVTTDPSGPSWRPSETQAARPRLLDALDSALDAMAYVHRAGWAHGRLDANTVRLGAQGQASIVGWEHCQPASPRSRAQAEDVRALGRLLAQTQQDWQLPDHEAKSAQLVRMALSNEGKRGLRHAEDLRVVFRTCRRPDQLELALPSPRISRRRFVAACAGVVGVAAGGGWMLRPPLAREPWIVSRVPRPVSEHEMPEGVAENVGTLAELEEGVHAVLRRLHERVYQSESEALWQSMDRGAIELELRVQLKLLLGDLGLRDPWMINGLDRKHALSYWLKRARVDTLFAARPVQPRAPSWLTEDPRVVGGANRQGLAIVFPGDKNLLGQTTDELWKQELTCREEYPLPTIHSELSFWSLLQVARTRLPEEGGRSFGWTDAQRQEFGSLMDDLRAREAPLALLVLGEARQDLERLWDMVRGRVKPCSVDELQSEVRRIAFTLEKWADWQIAETHYLALELELLAPFA